MDDKFQNIEKMVNSIDFKLDRLEDSIHKFHLDHSVRLKVIEVKQKGFITLASAFVGIIVSWVSYKLGLK